MARQNLWDLAVVHDHADITVGVQDTGDVANVARLSQAQQDLGRILIVYFDREGGTLGFRSIPEEVGR